MCDCTVFLVVVEISFAKNLVYSTFVKDLSFFSLLLMIMFLDCVFGVLFFEQAQYLLVLCSFKEQLQQHVRVHAVEAVMACREIEQNLQLLTGM